MNPLDKLMANALQVELRFRFRTLPIRPLLQYLTP